MGGGDPYYNLLFSFVRDEERLAGGRGSRPQ